ERDYRHERRADSCKHLGPGECSDVGDPEEDEQRPPHDQREEAAHQRQHLRAASDETELKSSIHNDACAVGPRWAARCGVLGHARMPAYEHGLRPCLAVAQRTPTTKAIMNRTLTAMKPRARDLRPMSP